MSTKTIKINPELFKVSGRKSRKSTDSKQASIKPVISSEQLKSKLIARVKQHKRDENATLNKAEAVKKPIISTRVKKPPTVKDLNGGDEFSKSLNFFSELSQRKKNAPIVATNLSKTIKKQTTIPTHVNVDLPAELMEILFDKQPPINNAPIASNPLKLNYVVDNLIPGCLKNGLKPTYKSLKRLNNPVTLPLVAQKLDEPIVREDRLTKIKQKMQQQQQQQQPTHALAPAPTPTHLSIDALPDILPGLESDDNILKEEFKRSNAKRNDINALLAETQTIVPQTIAGGSLITDSEDVLSILYPIKHKKTTVRTTKRSYTIGKNKNGSSVGVLIKDAHTRKKVMIAHKELKSKPINDIKTYLREHNLIKAGSSAPNDVLRKTYECAMFTGEVINTNEETLLHNFVNEPNG